LSRRFLLLCAVIALAIAALLAVSGGIRFTVGGFRVSARSPLAPSLAALALTGSWAWLAFRRGGAGADLTSVSLAVDRHAWTIVLVVAAASAGLAIAFGTFSAAGADASGYLSQAAMWAAGRLRVADGLVLLTGWPADPGMTAPLGWNASVERGWQVPTYGPGLPLLMALPQAIGGTLIAALTIALSSAIVIVASSAIALRLSGGPAAIVAAVTLATCPVFIFQSIQPMSDVPVTAAWMVCWALLIRSGDGNRQPASGSAFLSGAACAIAVLIRPNLAPLAIVPLAFVLRTANREQRMANGIAFSTPVVLSGALLGWLQWQWYGSPIRSGYGTVGQLYSWAYIGANASRYAGWLISTSPVLLLAAIGVWIRRGSAAWALAVFSLLNVAAYLVYFVFNEWSYLRFLLPAVASAAVFVGVAVAAFVNRLPAPARAAVLLGAVFVISGIGFSQSRSLDVFRLGDSHRRVLQIGRYLDAALPDRAVIISGEQSGAARYDTGRAIVRWEAATRADLERVLTLLAADRRSVWILLDAWEEPLVRDKFAGLTAVSLDWPPAVDAGETHRTRAWNLSDRARYLEGERVVTDRLR
jgi:hypothetical protein